MFKHLALKLKAVAVFAIGVFVVWLAPALFAIFKGSEANAIITLLAGFLIAIPTTFFVTLGALIGSFVLRRSAPLRHWTALIIGLVAGVVSEFLTQSVGSSPQVFRQFLIAVSGLHVFVRLIFVGIIAGIVLF